MSTMKNKLPFVTVKRSRGFKSMHSFQAYLGRTKADEAKLLQNCLEGLDQIFGRRAARQSAKRIFAL